MNKYKLFTLCCTRIRSYQNDDTHTDAFNIVCYLLTSFFLFLQSVDEDIWSGCLLMFNINVLKQYHCLCILKYECIKTHHRQLLDQYNVVRNIAFIITRCPPWHRAIVCIYNLNPLHFPVLELLQIKSFCARR